MGNSSVIKFSDPWNQYNTHKFNSGYKFDSLEEFYSYVPQTLNERRDVVDTLIKQERTDMFSMYLKYGNGEMVEFIMQRYYNFVPCSFFRNDIPDLQSLNGVKGFVKAIKHVAGKKTYVEWLASHGVIAPSGDHAEGDSAESYDDDSLMSGDEDSAEETTFHKSIFERVDAGFCEKDSPENKFDYDMYSPKAFVCGNYLVTKPEIKDCDLFLYEDTSKFNLLCSPYVNVTNKFGHPDTTRVILKGLEYLGKQVRILNPHQFVKDMCTSELSQTHGDELLDVFKIIFDKYGNSHPIPLDEVFADFPSGHELKIAEHFDVYIPPPESEGCYIRVKEQAHTDNEKALFNKYFHICNKNSEETEKNDPVV